MSEKKRVSMQRRKTQKVNIVVERAEQEFRTAQSAVRHVLECKEETRYARLSERILNALKNEGTKRFRKYSNPSLERASVSATSL